MNSTKVKNYNKELKQAFSALIDLGGQKTLMHLALATADYKKIDDISDKTLIELINQYIAIKEVDIHSDLETIEDFENDFNEDQEDLF